MERLNDASVPHCGHEPAVQNFVAYATKFCTGLEGRFMESAPALGAIFQALSENPGRTRLSYKC